MKLWQRLVSRARALVTREKPSTTRIYYTGKTTAGEYITPDNAVRQAAVWGCLSYLSKTVAQLPWRTLLDTAQGAQQVRNVASHRLLAVRPNPEMGPFSFKEQMVWWAASEGNAVAELVFNARGEPVEAWPIHPSRVEFKRDIETGELLYECCGEMGDVTTLRGPEVLHLRGFGNGPVGLNVIAYAAESIGWARATEVFGAAYFGQGMAPSGIMSTKARLSPEGRAALERSLDERMGGKKGAHRTFVTDSEATYTRLAPDPEVMQLVETRQHQVEEVCRWFGVPPHKVMHLLRSTFSNIEHQSIEVVVDSITPWCLRMEEEANYKLFGANRQGFYTKLDTKGLLRGDYKSRQEGLQIMRRNGIVNADEWRAFEDMGPLPGGIGKKYIVEGNMTTLDTVGEPPKPAPALPAAVGEEENDDEGLPAVERARRQRERAERNLH